MEQYLKKAWKLFSDHVQFLLVSTVVGVFLPIILMCIIPFFLTQALIEKFNPNYLVGVLIFIYIVLTIIAVLIQVGLMKSALIITNGGTPTTKDLLLDFQTYLRGFIAGFICLIMLVIGYTLCIIPGIILMFFILFVPYIILDDPEIGIFNAIKKSFKLVSIDKSNTIGVMFVGLIIQNVSSGFGSPFVFILYAILYRDLKNKLENPTQPDVVPIPNNYQQYNQQQPPQLEQ